MRNSSSTIVALAVLGFIAFMALAMIKSWIASAPSTPSPTSIPYTQAHSPSEFLRLEEARLSCSNGKASIYGSVRVEGTMNTIRDAYVWVKLYDKKNTLIVSGSSKVHPDAYGKLHAGGMAVGYSFGVEDMNDPNCLGSEYKIRFTGTWD